MKKIIISLIVFTIFFIAPLYLFAQFPPPGGTGGGGPITDPVAGVPIDGGISFLIAAGVAYAGKKFYDKRKDNKENSEEK